MIDDVKHNVVVHNIGCTLTEPNNTLSINQVNINVFSIIDILIDKLIFKSIIILSNAIIHIFLLESMKFVEGSNGNHCVAYKNWKVTNF